MTRQPDENAAPPHGTTREREETRRDPAEERGAGESGRRAGVGAHGASGEDYYYRRRLDGRDLWTAAGIAAGAGVAAFYLASLFLQRTPLEAPRSARGGRRGRGRATTTSDTGAR